MLWRGGAALIVSAVSVRDATTDECSDGGLVHTYNRTWQEVKDAYDAGTPVYIQAVNQGGNSKRYYLSAVDAEEYGAEFIYFKSNTPVAAVLTAPTPTDPLVWIACEDK